VLTFELTVRETAQEEREIRLRLAHEGMLAHELRVKRG
jgi:hypothetical protein